MERVLGEIRSIVHIYTRVYELKKKIRRGEVNCCIICWVNFSYVSKEVLTVFAKRPVRDTCSVYTLSSFIK
jgi:hypothetical protein